MSDPDALQEEMRRLLLGEFGGDPLALDGETADRLLAGRLDPADAPPGYAEVAVVLSAVAGPPTPVELAGEAAATATFVATVRPTARSRRRAGGRRTALGSRLVALAAAALCAMLVGGVAAAATGTLPEPARRVVHAVTRAAHHQPARHVVPRHDPGEVRSGSEGRGRDGAAAVGGAGTAQHAHGGRMAPAAPAGPDATGRAEGKACASPPAGRDGVDSANNGCGQKSEAPRAKAPRAKAPRANAPEGKAPSQAQAPQAKESQAKESQAKESQQQSAAKAAQSTAHAQNQTGNQQR
jgi:hypothetical protein